MSEKSGNKSGERDSGDNDFQQEAIMRPSHVIFAAFRAAMPAVLMCWPVNTATTQERPQRPIPEWQINRPAAKKYAVDAAQLREAGLAVQLEQTDFAFPNRCHGKLTISDAFLKSFEAKGFSLVTLCLGIRAPLMYYHPETGEPLTNLLLKNSGPRSIDGSWNANLLIEVPDCFRNGTPYHDCVRRFESAARRPLNPKDPKNLDEWRASDIVNPWAIDAAMNKLLAANRFGSQCQCEDLEKIMCRPRSYNLWCGVPDKEVPSFRPKTGTFCYLEKVPMCAQQISENRVAAESMQFELDAGELWKLVGRQGTGFLNERIEISPNLPRGFAYTWIAPEGDDDTPYTELPIGTRIGVGVE